MFGRSGRRSDPRLRSRRQWGVPGPWSAVYPTPMAGARKDRGFAGPEGEAAPGPRGRGWAARTVRVLRPLARSKPVRVVRNYGRNRGPLLAAGLSFHATFAASAAAWLGPAMGGRARRSGP